MEHLVAQDLVEDGARRRVVGHQLSIRGEAAGGRLLRHVQEGQEPRIGLAFDADVEPGEGLLPYLFLAMYRRRLSSLIRLGSAGDFARPSHGSGPSPSACRSVIGLSSTVAPASVR